MTMLLIMQVFHIDNVTYVHVLDFLQLLSTEHSF